MTVVIYKNWVVFSRINFDAILYLRPCSVGKQDTLPASNPKVSETVPV